MAFACALDDALHDVHHARFYQARFGPADHCEGARLVSDAAGESVPPELIGLVTEAGKLRPVRALALGVTRPQVLPRALALRHATQRALAAVARLLTAFTA